MSSPGFWLDRSAADEKIKQLGRLQGLIKEYDEVEGGIAGGKKGYSVAE